MNTRPRNKAKADKVMAIRTLKRIETMNEQLMNKLIINNLIDEDDLLEFDKWAYTK
jgi:hypothetical protein